MKDYRDPREEYSAEDLHQDRKYGLFWYSWLWHMLRPVALFLCVLIVAGGIIMAGWNWIDRSFFAPVDETDPTPITFTVASGSSLTRVSNNLEAQGLIKNSTFFKYYCDFAGMGQKIQAGSYVLKLSLIHI